VDGEKFTTLRGPRIADEFKALVEEYIEARYARGAPKGQRLAVKAKTETVG
jgi:(E)-4-hydroxy-3-methylbut-2-enyl-diphosphate synthase